MKKTASPPRRSAGGPAAVPAAPSVAPISGASARVAALLLEGGPATASELAKTLALTPAAVRRHLDSLEASGHIEANERVPYGPTPPRGRGRPAKVYSLTHTGREVFNRDYDDVAVDVLRYLAQTAGDDAVLDFARQRAAKTESRYAQAMAACTSQNERITALRACLSDDGFAAEIQPAKTAGYQMCQHHCPVSHVAQEFPQFCEAEAESFSRLLATHVTRLATLAAGDGVCTTLIPLSAERTSA